MPRIKKDNKSYIGLRLSSEELEVLDKLAKKNFRDRSSEIRKAISEYIERNIKID